MRYPAKPKKEVTRANVAKLASGWDFFPPSAHAKVARLVTSAIDAYHDLARPEPDDVEGLRVANLAPPSPPRRGRPAEPRVGILVSRLAQIYAKSTQKLGTRSADGTAKHTDFERFVEGAFGVIGIEKSAREAVKRHVKARNKLPDNFANQGDSQ